MQLQERLAIVVKILEEDNWALDQDQIAKDTGFVACLPSRLAECIIKLVELAPPPRTVLDMGCGNGGFALLAAAAGYDAYGVEINNYVLERGKRNLQLAQEAGAINHPCKLIVGDMIPKKYHDRYAQFIILHTENPASMPLGDGLAYDTLPIDISTADIIYCWSWPTQSRFVYNMLEDEAKPDCIFILPNYVRYTQGEHMNAFFKEHNRLVLSDVYAVKDIIIGKRAS